MAEYKISFPLGEFILRFSAHNLLLLQFFTILLTAFYAPEHTDGYKCRKIRSQ
jgi:hypothetical protein